LRGPREDANGAAYTFQLEAFLISFISSQRPYSFIFFLCFGEMILGFADNQKALGDTSNTLPDPCVPPSPLHREQQKEPFSPDEITPSKPHKHPIVSRAESEENSPLNKDGN